MTEAEWLACADPRPMLDHLAYAEQDSERKLRLFAIACCRGSRQTTLVAAHREVLAACERYADGGALSSELAAVYSQANGRAVGMYPGKVTTERQVRRWAEATAVARAAAGAEAPDEMIVHAIDAAWMTDRAAHRNPSVRLAAHLRCIFGNPFRPATLANTSRTGVAMSLARAAYDERELPSGHLDPARLLVLADALAEAGCDDAAILGHLRSAGPHVRGCWALDLVLGKE